MHGSGRKAPARCWFRSITASRSGVLMMMLGKQQINSVWVEAGATLAGALLQAGLVDELIVYIAPKLLGNAARGLCALPGLEELSQAPHFKFNEIRQVGPDVCLHLTTA